MWQKGGGVAEWLRRHWTLDREFEGQNAVALSPLPLSLRVVGSVLNPSGEAKTLDPVCFSTGVCMLKISRQQKKPYEC